MMSSKAKERMSHSGPLLSRDREDESAGRAFKVTSAFVSGVLAILLSQALGMPLKVFDRKLYRGYMSWTKESFAVLLLNIIQWWSPTTVNVSGDASMENQLCQMPDGSLKCKFPHRLVLMANHQLYTDWLYIWWSAYTNKMHGHLYIIMKESLKHLPIIGWSGQLFRFIYLSRDWEKDKIIFQRALRSFNSPREAMWLSIFPEGTNLSAETREKSAAWSKRSGIADMKHQLLPRTKGLQLCLKELGPSTKWLYDCTLAYGGIPQGRYGQDIYTIHSTFLAGKPPTTVNMHWRRFRISHIPYHNDAAFTRWLNNRWREKDYLLEYFRKHESFPDYRDVNLVDVMSGVAARRNCKFISTEVRGDGLQEVLGIFEPVSLLSGLLSSVDFSEPISLEMLEKVLIDGNKVGVPPRLIELVTKRHKEMASDCPKPRLSFEGIPLGSPASALGFRLHKTHASLQGQRLQDQRQLHLHNTWARPPDLL